MQKVDDIGIFNRVLTNGIIQQMHVSVPVNLADSERSKLREISDCIFESKVTLDHYRAVSNVRFINCTFKEEMTIIKSTFEGKLNFTNCFFAKELKIKNAQFKFCEFDGGSYQNLNFEGGINAQEDTTGELVFLNGTFDTLNITCKIVNARLDFKGGKFENIYCFNTTFNYPFNIEGTSISSNFIHVSSCNFMDRVDFKQSLTSENITFHRTTFHQMVVFHEEHHCFSLRMVEIIAKQSFSIISNNTISALSLEDCDFNSNFSCHYYKDKSNRVNHDLNVTLEGFLRGNIIFEDIIVTTITISCNNFGNIVFRNIETYLITIKNFLNYNKLTFANLKLVYKNRVIIIFDSNIDKTEFVNVDFRKFKEIVIARSEVSNIILSNSILPPRIQIGSTDPIYGYTIPIDDRINDNTYHRENYRQLKQAMEKQGNRSAALLFKSKEMHYLRQELNWGCDKVLLYLNYYSNNHGLSWARGLIFTFILSTLMYFLFELSLGKSFIDHSRFYGFAQTRIGFSSATDYTEFLSSFPLYKTQSDQVTTWQTHIVIMLSRILIGYGVYQTIAAFRKFAG